MILNTDEAAEELPIFQYKYILGGERGTYETTFLISGDCLKTHCNCKHPQPCWHIEYVLAGKTSRITGGDMAQQKEMIEKAESTAEGRFLLRKAKKKYAQETHCRRCSSQNIVKLKSSVLARLITVFRETKNHTYYCKDCKWTW